MLALALITLSSLFFPPFFVFSLLFFSLPSLPRLSRARPSRGSSPIDRLGYDRAARFPLTGTITVSHHHDVTGLFIYYITVLLLLGSSTVGWFRPQYTRGRNV